jgi:hypothetical protein
MYPPLVGEILGFSISNLFLSLHTHMSAVSLLSGLGEKVSEGSMGDRGIIISLVDCIVTSVHVSWSFPVMKIFTIVPIPPS